MLKRLIEKRIGSLNGPMTARTRSAWGKAASFAGIGANALLFAFKLLAGGVSGSVAVTADAVNNLSDASSSVISLLGFKLAEKPADAEHPYGHGRMEYLSGLMVAVMILVIGVELMISSVKKILSPVPVRVNAPVLAVLGCSIGVKLWLSAFNRRIGRAIGSPALEAAADDSRNDVISTSAVLLSMIIAHFSGLTLDGYMGAAVAAFILVSGLGLVRDAVSPMLGAAPEKEFADDIRKKLESYPGVLGVHDLLVHDYGPGRKYASVHLEMDAGTDSVAAHDLIDGIEREFLTEKGLHLVIHHDPVEVDDPRIAVMKTAIADICRRIDPGIAIHDLRMTPEGEHTHIVFDCVVPYGCADDTEEIRSRISSAVADAYPGYRCVITLEHSFVRTQQ